MTWQRVVVLGLAVGVLQGCREDLPLSEDVSDDGSSDPPPPQVQQMLAFNVTGLTTPSRTYTQLSASYSQSTGITIIQTIGDSVAKGKFVLQFRGGSTGLYRYNVVGASNDVKEMDIRFVPSYEGASPSSVFELTENPFDSLQAQTTITRFGGVGDSISGIFSAQLKLVDPPVQFKIFLYDGEFKVRRTE